ncbi:hypothetical protein LUZ60_009410 [Juncus effusus]|nr:hypothetical protein LUZ60_009410 [Juncus effusus]
MLDEIKKINFTGVTGQFTFDPSGELVRPAYDIINVVGTCWRTIGYWSNFTSLTILTPEELYDKPENFSFEKKLYDVIWPGEAVALLPYPLPYRFIKNSNYTDLCNKVASNDFDAAIGDIMITMDRAKIVDFTRPYFDSGLSIELMKNSGVRPRNKLPPFVGMLSTFWSDSLCNTKYIRNSRSNLIFFLISISNSYIAYFTRCRFSFSTLFFTHRENTMSNLGRAVLIVWLFVVLIIQSSYTASLASTLTAQELSTQIHGIETLRSSNDPIGYQTGSLAMDYMVDELGIARDRLVGLSGAKDYLKALELGPSNGGVAAVVDEISYVKQFLGTGNECRFSIIGLKFTRTGWGFAFPRDSPLAIDMSTAMLTLSENGELQKIHNKWLNRNTTCSSDVSTAIDTARLDIGSFWVLFLICGVACMIALIIYLCIMLRQYIQHVPVDERNPSSQAGQTGFRSGCSLKSFLSFADEKKEAKIRSVRGQAEMRNGINTIDIED